MDVCSSFGIGLCWPLSGLLDSEPVINKWVMMVVQSCMGVKLSSASVFSQEEAGLSQG